MPAPAGQLYVGGFHLACRRAAAVLTTPDRILIPSVPHGLLPLDRVIAPYELRMGQPGSISPAEMRRQGEQLHLVDEPRVIVLAGRAYTDAARRSGRTRPLPWPALAVSAASSLG